MKQDKNLIVTFLSATTEKKTVKKYADSAFFYAQQFAMKKLDITDLPKTRANTTEVKSDTGIITVEGTTLKELFSADVKPISAKLAKFSPEEISQMKLDIRERSNEADSDAVTKVAKTFGVDVKKYAHLKNAGLIKMNIVNSLLGAIVRQLKHSEITLEDATAISF